MKKLLLMGIVMLLVTHYTSAQCPMKGNVIQPGETIKYDLYFNWQFVWVKAGDAIMNTSKTTYNGKPALKTFLRTAGSKKADFFFVMRDTLTSIMSPELVPYYFCKRAEEGKRYTVDEVNFSYVDNQCHVVQSRHRRGKQPLHSTYHLNDCAYDMLSLISRMRASDLSHYQKGDRIALPMATGSVVEDETLIFRGKEDFTADNGVTYRCIVISLIDDHTDKDKERESITFYVTDDANHLPVRLDMYLHFGVARAYVKSIEGNKYPLKSIVKKKK